MRREIERLKREVLRIKENKKISFLIVKEIDGVYYLDNDDEKIILSEDEIETLKNKYSHFIVIKKV